MSDEFDYLNVDTSDKQVLKRLSDMGEQLKQLKVKQLAAEEAAVQAKKEYEHYAHVVLPAEMRACGVDSISLSTGGTMSIKHNFYCQPNKNEADRKIIADWLRAHGGAHLIVHDATVSADDMDKLDAEGIPYIENATVNTASLKSFLKEGIGATSGVQQFTIEDIPACVHFQEVNTVEINLPK